ncbi:hypothetical protein BSLG_004929 [Batrachochytrium salamandrivorans]|nr:hypothetical protein BSLG_004929 [Batrachochytrium salamandrivorans]
MTESVLASTSNPFNLVMDGHHISTWILHGHFFMSMAWLEGLDRLVLLLDTGSTASVRSTAAKQLGQVQKQHPDDLYHLLSRILVHLRSKSWDTRVAAASSAMEISSTTTDASVAAADLEELLFGFDSFDILDVLHRGAVLVASSGGEFDVDLSGMDSKERIAFQKKQLRERLGLATQFMDVSFVEESDLGAGAHTAASATTVDTKLPINQVVDASSKVKQDPDAAEAPDPYAGLSARRRNRLKRKAKLIAKSGGKDTSQIVDLSSSSLFKKRRMGEDTPVTIKAENDTGASALSSTSTAPGSTPTPTSTSDINGKVVVEHKGIDAASLGVYSSGDEWPFEGLCEQLSLDLFSPIWEIRHGAAIGLRELLKAHGTGLGRIVGLSRAANIARHRAWTEDLAIRLLCVLALDRFADFVGDQAVLPVRETCAQTLGTLMHLSDPELCLLVVNKGFVPLIGDPFGQANGQEQQRGLDTLLSPVYAAVLNGLKDHNDDVRAVASSALIPVSDLVVSLLPIETVFHTLVMSLWDSLHELDDLTSATSHVMDLLSNLVAIPEVATMMRLEAGNFFQSLVPQLFPFRHAITSVRLAVLRTFSTLVGLSEQDTSATAVAWISCDLLHLVYQNFMLEENAKIVDLSLTLWTRMTRLLLKQYPAHMDSSPVYSEMTNILPNLFALLMTPIGTALDQRLLVQFTSSNPQRKTQPASPILADASLRK